MSGLSSDNDNNLFSIGHYDGVLRFKEPLDYYPEGDNTYSLMIVGYTGRNEASWLSVKVTVTDVNEAPEFAGQTATRSIGENTAAGENIGDPITATDDDDATLTYTLGGTDAASFDIVEETGQLQTKDLLDHETTPSYTVTVSVSDGKDASGTTDTAADDEIRVTITVTTVNEAPELDGETATRSIAENTEAGGAIGEPITATDDDDATLAYTLGGTDAASFDIVEATGQLQTKSPLDHETTPSYTVTVSVSDGKDASGAADSATDDEITVTITVIDEDEPPPALDTPVIAVDATDGHDSISVHWQESDATGIPPITGYDVEYHIVGAPDWSSDNVVVNGADAAITDLDPSTSYEARVRAKNDEGEGLWAYSEPASTVALALQQTTTTGGGGGGGGGGAPLNRPPELSEGSTTDRSIAENTPAGTNIGDPVAASDREDDALTYSLRGAEAVSFDIDASTGQLLTKDPLDYEAKTSYSAIVAVSDGRTPTADPTTRRTTSSQ